MWTFHKITDSVLFEYDKASPFNSTHYTVLYPQNGGRIVTIDSVTSLHPVCRTNRDCKMHVFQQVLSCQRSSVRPWILNATRRHFRCGNCIGTDLRRRAAAGETHQRRPPRYWLITGLLMDQLLYWRRDDRHCCDRPTTCLLLHVVGCRPLPAIVNIEAHSVKSIVHR